MFGRNSWRRRWWSDSIGGEVAVKRSCCQRPYPLSILTLFFFSSRRRHTRYWRDWIQTCALPICLTAPDSALSHSLTNIEKISTSLTENDNIEVTLRNLRNSSEKLKVATTELEPAGTNIKQFSETIKTQPWRLIWPSTKKYAEASSTPAPGQGTITVRKSAKTKPRPRATPTRTSSR